MIFYHGSLLADYMFRFLSPMKLFLIVLVMFFSAVSCVIYLFSFLVLYSLIPLIPSPPLPSPPPPIPLPFFAFVCLFWMESSCTYTQLYSPGLSAVATFLLLFSPLPVLVVGANEPAAFLLPILYFLPPPHQFPSLSCLYFIILCSDVWVCFLLSWGLICSACLLVSSNMNTLISFLFLFFFW